MSLPQESSTAEQVFYTWVARSRSGSSSFTASALNKHFLLLLLLLLTALALNKPSSFSSSSSSSSSSSPLGRYAMRQSSEVMVLLMKRGRRSFT